MLDFMNPLNLTFQALFNVVLLVLGVFNLAVLLNLLGCMKLAEHVLRNTLFLTSSAKLIIVDGAAHILNRLAMEDHFEAELCEAIAELNIFRAEAELLIEHAIIDQQ